MRFRPFTFFLLIIILLTVLNIIFVYESTTNAKYDDQTKERSRMLLENYVASRNAINILNETRYSIRSNAFNDTDYEFFEVRHGVNVNVSINETVMEYIPKTESVKLTFQQLFDQLVKKDHKNQTDHLTTSTPTSNLKPDNNNVGYSVNNSTPNNEFLIQNQYNHISDLIKKTVKWYSEIDTNKEYKYHCKQCALVTSSGRLLNQSVGSEIDSNDCVIRMNDAPVIGFEKDVGLRTDIRVMGHPNLATIKSDPENLLEIFHKNVTKTKILFIPWLYNTTVNKTADKYYAILRNLTKMFPDVKFYVPSKEAMEAAETIFEYETGLQRPKLKTWFTTGWQTMLLSISICEQITVYGMPQESHCSNSSDRTPYHYYNERGKRECGYYISSERRLDTGHIFLTEKAVFFRWAEEFNITFRTPSWNMTEHYNGTLDTPFIQMYRRAQERFDRLQKERKEWRERIKRRNRANTPTEEPLYFLLFSVTLLVVVLKGCDILTFIVIAIVPQSWQDW